MPPFRPIPVGTRFGRLVTTAARTRGQRRIPCLCDCGRRTVIRVGHLTTQSCGCLRRETTALLTARHGMAHTRIYAIWSDMVGRCNRKTHVRYADYGGRGIAVCERWRDFVNFYADMGERPDSRSLDRKDNDGGYSPENCRWATAEQQAQNKRGYGPAFSRGSLA